MMGTALTGGPEFVHDLLPRAKRTSLYSIQALARRHPGWYRADLSALLGMLARGEIAPHVGKVWSLDEAPTAIAGFARGSLPGKQVIEVGA